MACCGPTAGRSVAKGAARNWASSPKAFNPALSRIRGIQGNAAAMLDNTAGFWLTRKRKNNPASDIDMAVPKTDQDKRRFLAVELAPPTDAFRFPTARNAWRRFTPMRKRAAKTISVSTISKTRSPNTPMIWCCPSIKTGQIDDCVIRGVIGRAPL